MVTKRLNPVSNSKCEYANLTIVQDNRFFSLSTLLILKDNMTLPVNSYPDFVPI